MTSEVKIQVNEIRGALLVPIQAVAEHKGDFYAFVEGPKAFETRKVKPGEPQYDLYELDMGSPEELWSSCDPFDLHIGSKAPATGKDVAEFVEYLQRVTAT